MKRSEVLDVIANYWNEASSTFDKDHDTENLEKWTQTLEELLGPDKNVTVLDLGGGSGFLANLVARAGYRAVAVDISTGMLNNGVRHARREHTPTFFMKGDAANLPFMDNSIDFIINSRLIWTIEHPDEMLKEWIRVLAPGGKIFCFNRMDENEIMVSWDKEVAYDNEEVSDALSLKSASSQYVVDLFTSCGYVHSKCTKLPGLARPEHKLAEWFVASGEKPISATFENEIGLANYWDNRASTYDAEHELNDEETWIQVLSDLVGPNKNERIIDVATGTGLIANYLGSAGYADITGYDISEQMMRFAIDRARERGNDISFIYGSAHNIPEDTCAVDVVISSRLLWTLPEPQSALEEWYRVLVPGGRVIAINELEDEIRVGLSDMSLYKEKTQVSDFPLANATREEIREMFESAGFKNVVYLKMQGCRLKEGTRENWFAFIGEK